MNMNKFMAFLPVLLLVSTQLVAAPPENPPPIEIDAFVVNDTENPVPVDIVGTPEIDVTNTPDMPLYVQDVDRRTRTPVLDGCSIFIEDGNTSDSCSFDEVEPGKRLVVEFISGQIRYPVGQTGEVHTILSAPNSFFQNHFLLQTLQRINNFGADMYVVSQTFRIDVDELNQLGVRVIRSPDDTGGVDGSFWITGYLVNVEE
jgi:hypothetical protein